MKILNLVNLEESDIKYKISKFPDGQQNCKIVPPYLFWIPGDSIQIKARLNDFKDLELIICTVASLRGLGVKEIHLYTPYFLGSRSDRKFEEGSNNYLKDVICPIVNSLKLDSITVLDPHSDVLEACLSNYKKETNLELIKWSFDDITYENIGNVFDECVLISPDAGASKKIYKLAEQIGYKGDIITCSKDRDTEGRLAKTVIPPFNSKDKDVIIIDDICDGGATFINIAKELKPFVTGKIYLIVTHGIFSKGLVELSNYFDGVYTTNSYSDFDKVRASSIILNQLNIF